MRMKNKTRSAVYFILMHAGFLIYSTYALAGKIASKQEFLSPLFLALYAAVFVILIVYALIWQQVLKVIPLTVATANKTITIVWGIIAGRFIFNEAVSLKMLIGAALILTGIVILSTGKNNEQQS